MDLKNLKPGDTGVVGNKEVFSMGIRVGSFNELEIEAERKGLTIDIAGTYITLRSNDSPFGAICLAS